MNGKELIDALVIMLEKEDIRVYDHNIIIKLRSLDSAQLASVINGWSNPIND
jgi:hypothetical protein